jgi:hypothetical protein
MSRMDFKQGRFSADQETDRMFRGMRGWRDVNGDWMDYYRFDADATQVHPVYGEVIGQGRIYKPPVRMPCLHVTHLRGANENGTAGFYTSDDLDATIPFDLFLQMGMNYADIDTQNYLKDRVLYDTKVFRVTNIAVRGQIQERDVIVGVTAAQCKPDELVDDATFAQWSA